MTLVLKDGTSWAETYRRCMQAAPEAFDPDRIRNLIAGEWTRAGAPGEHSTPVDGTEIEGPPRIDHPAAEAAVEGAVRQHHEWGRVGLDERRDRVSRAVAAMREHRDLLARPSVPLRLPEGFAQRLDAVLVPGVTVLVTDLPGVQPQAGEPERPVQPVLESDEAGGML